jgi:AmmeMemoRadiSam system protein B/AmmeMemoRadiSam system protein A
MMRSPHLGFAPSLRCRSLALTGAIATLAVCGAGNLSCEAEPMKAVRPSALAGSWYAADPGELAAAVDTHLTRGKPLAEIAAGVPVALIAPHAGHQWSGDAAGCAFRLIQDPAGRQINRVILLGPSHYQAFRGASVPDVEAFATPLGSVPLDREVVSALARKPGFVAAPAAHSQEHCLEIQLPFLQRALAHPFRIVPILISHVDAAGRRALAEALAPYVDEHTLIVASSDFTHFGGRFGYLPFHDDVDRKLRALDKGALIPILNLDPDALAAYHEETEISVCGIHPIGVLLEILGQPELQRRWKGRPEGRVLEYYRSADLTGDFDGSVSYAAVGFFRPGDLSAGPRYPARLAEVHLPGEEPPAGDPDSSSTRTPAAPPRLELNPAEQRFLLALARDTVRRLTSGKAAPASVSFPESVSAEKLTLTCGAFVTLTKGARLRGCIGSIVGTEPLYRCVIDNAGNAALRDPRFSPVTSGELPEIEFEISVLTPLQEIAGPEEIEIGRHGVVLEREGHRAVFLPQVAPEQGWDRETMLDHLAMKAGLPRNAWRSGARFEVFEALVFSEEELRRKSTEAH